MGDSRVFLFKLQNPIHRRPLGGHDVRNLSPKPVTDHDSSNCMKLFMFLQQDLIFNLFAGKINMAANLDQVFALPLRIG